MFNKYDKLIYILSLKYLKNFVKNISISYIVNLQTYEYSLSYINEIKGGARGVMVLLPNPSARAGYDTRSIFKRSLTGLNSEFSFS